MVGQLRQVRLADILSDKQVHHVVRQVLGQEDWEIFGSELKRAAEGLSGFLGDHFRAVINVGVDGEEKKVRIFIKHMPLENKPKEEFIDEHKYFKREMMTFKLFAEALDTEDPNPCCTNALIVSDSMVVMPDLSAQGYTQVPSLNTFDLPHVLATVASMAHFHATAANYETKKSRELGRPYTILEYFGDNMTEPTFKDSPWLRAAAKLSTDLINAFSYKYKNNVPNLESKLTKLYIKGCDSLNEYPDTLNVLIHKDLWANNIMFRYNAGVPVNAILIDFQCVRYGPPTFDLMAFLYLTTSRSFRELHETDVWRYYYSMFMNKIDSHTKQRLDDLKYNEEEFLKWCEKSRMFGMFDTIAIFPYILMEPKVAQQTFDDPETYVKYLEDRSEPVLAHCQDSVVYRDRQVEVTEEFIERFVLSHV